MNRLSSVFPPAVFAVAVAAGLQALPHGALAIEAGDAMPDFEIRDTAGIRYRSADLAGKVVVLEWTHYGCPFVGKLYKSGKLPGMQERFLQQGVVWLVVASGASAEMERLTKHEISSLQKAGAVLVDEDASLAKAFGARTAPHLFVFDRRGKLAFEGGVDDNRSPSLETAFQGRNFLEEALVAVLKGGVPEVTAAKPYGCAIKQ